MPHFVGKVILNGFLWPVTFKLHFQYGRRRPSWILMVGQVKIQKRYQKWLLHAIISRKSVLHSFRCQFVFTLHFQYVHRRPFWILDFSQIPPPFSRGSWGLNFFEILDIDAGECFLGCIFRVVYYKVKYFAEYLLGCLWLIKCMI